MNQNTHHAMNGYHLNNGASTSSHGYNEYPSPHQQQSLFNSNGGHHQPQRQHPPQSMQQRLSQNHQWPPTLQMNAQQQAIPPQHQSPFNPSWTNQMPPPPPFPNGMHSMAGFNMNFLPQQVIQEAYAMSVPVAAEDEPVLMSTLLNSRKRGESFKDALNSLHGKGGHSASLWKDYYLDNKDRIDAWIAMCVQKGNDKTSAPSRDLSRSTTSERETPVATIKKPSPASFKRESSPTISTRVAISAPPVKRPKKSNQSTPPVQVEQSAGSRRSTINSLTAPAPVYGSRLPAPNSEIKIPEPPSRCPSPPTKVVPHRGRGNKYTEEDREYFIKFVGWQLKQDRTLTRHAICELLAEKAPHHTAQSWASHWSNNHDLPDKILAAARGDEYEGSDESDSSVEKMTATKRKPKYKETTTSEESDGSESENESASEPEDDDEDEGKPLRQWTEKDMGEKGGPFTDADQYIAAKYIASFPKWEDALTKDRWAPFHEKYPQRSAKSWAEYYRRNERPIENLIKRIRKETKPTHAGVSSIHTQCARPTRTPPKVKRKYDLGSNDEIISNSDRAKRGRADSGATN
ncbi:hypothetical protein B0H34DRAFT_28743 [Crassisporium funariophilum]|nr:hypothetical protein B0H34DRAFT_28743 [Crassisporium funariophilum]